MVNGNCRYERKLNLQNPNASTETFLNLYGKFVCRFSLTWQAHLSINVTRLVHHNRSLFPKVVNFKKFNRKAYLMA